MFECGGPDVTSVGIVVMATGRYMSFLEDLVVSATEHVNGLSAIYVLADRKPEVKSPHIKWLPWGHFPWPISTLLRYRAQSTYASTLANVDVLLYVDVDMKFIDTVDVTNCQGIFAVNHPGYSEAGSSPLPFERSSNSSFKIADVPNSTYFCGGVQGGQSNAYLEACSELAKMIDYDLARDLVPLWHDESAWNWWCHHHPPAMQLSRDYCTPDSEDLSNAHIVALSKDHDFYRSINTRWTTKQTRKIRFKLTEFLRRQKTKFFLGERKK
jgi:hypothetical protein